ncbi:fasciclin domain-containing protein [Roseovarius spongiae]|uniref:Fasciclin domain-containing protein n=1 Tax=Roseovarius spongiae TaxID=2320272 RepID=A0A3A8AV45_9RHOB|nr:fasciclin domain-containing protein [Roseovarius spongiae]RKF14958.1 fasciclin domain-containing protein [Roseovarius spongiae]
MTYARILGATAAICLGATAAVAGTNTSTETGTQMIATSNPMVGGAAMFADKNIVENAVNSADHTTLVAAVKAAGLVSTLQGEGPFTVFAPTNAAFAALPEGTVETLLKPENKEMLTKVLTCHVVGADAMSGDIMGMIDDDGGSHMVPTLGGCMLKATYGDGTITLEDERGQMIHVTIADVKQSNGVIHVVDGVILPAE